MKRVSSTARQGARRRITCILITLGLFMAGVLSGGFWLRNISHVFMVDRPGQRRGVSWYTPVMAELMDIHKFTQGTLKRQEVAAMFAGILKTTGGDDDPDGGGVLPPDMEAGGIMELGQHEELDFNQPPNPVDFDPVSRVIDRVIATGLMLTYESFTGDYSRVNYTSGRMGRMDQDPIDPVLAR